MPKRSIWDEESNVALAAKMWREGKTATFIGKYFGVSANSVIQKLQRAGLTKAARQVPSLKSF